MRRERENILIAIRPTSSQPNAGERASKTSVISAITECVRPEFEILTQRTACLVVPEIGSRKMRRARQDWAGRFFENRGFLAGTSYPH